MSYMVVPPVDPNQQISFRENPFMAPPPAPVRAPEQTLDGQASNENKKSTSKSSTRSRKGAVSVSFEADKQAEHKARIKMESDYPVVAELVTNAPMADAQTLLVLSAALSDLYNRPLSSITASLHTTEYLLHDHSFTPSYNLRIIVPATLATLASNDAHAAALTRFLCTELSIPPGRGRILFLGIPEECIAVGGRTLMGVYREDVQAEKAARTAREEREAEETAERRRGRAGGRFRSVRGVGARGGVGGEGVVVERGEGEVALQKMWEEGEKDVANARKPSLLAGFLGIFGGGGMR